MESEDIRLLVVDDEVDLCRSIGNYFEIFGYQTKTVNGGQEALDILAQESFQLVITDIHMPKVDGVELLEKIKAKDVHIPKVLVISGDADLPVEELYNKGADGFFSKPFNSRGMLEAVCKATVPVEELWKQAPSIEPEHELTFSCDYPCKGIAFGRGGLSVAHDRALWGVDDMIRLQIKLNGTELPEIYGAGMVRWKNIYGQSGHQGSGIEITYLEESCRAEFSKWLIDLPGPAYIPIL